MFNTNNPNLLLFVKEQAIKMLYNYFGYWNVRWQCQRNEVFELHLHLR